MSGLTLFRVGAGVSVLVGVLHGIGSLRPPPADPAYVFARDAMVAFKLGRGGLETNLHWIHALFNQSYTAFAFWVGALNLAAAPAFAADPRLLRNVSLVNALGSAALVWLALHYHVAPPAIFYALAGLAFAAAAARAR